MTWRTSDVTVDEIDGEARDLVSVTYVLNELAPEARYRLIERLWRLTADILVIVEPGTPAGWQRILAARRQLIEAGGRTGATSRDASHARACTDRPRAPSFPGKTKSSAMWRSRESWHRRSPRASLPGREKPAAVSR